MPLAFQLAASATGDDRATLTEVSMKAEGLAQALYRFEGKNVPELPLRKVWNIAVAAIHRFWHDGPFQGELIVLTKKVDENWLEGKNEFGRRGIFPANYVRIVNEPSSKQTGISVGVLVRMDKRSWILYFFRHCDGIYGIGTSANFCEVRVSNVRP